MKNRIIAIVICILSLGAFLIFYEGTTKNNHEEVPSTTQVLKATQYNKKAKKKKKKKTTKKAKHTKQECINFAYNEVINRYHWSETDWNNLYKLWNKESGWKYNDKYGSCYGIPQACPGNKMKSRGSDWETNCYTQINWGLGYIANRYGNPSKAWKHSQKKGWY